MALGAETNATVPSRETGQRMTTPTQANPAQRFQPYSQNRVNHAQATPIRPVHSRLTPYGSELASELLTDEGQPPEETLSFQLSDDREFEDDGSGPVSNHGQAEDEPQASRGAAEPPQPRTLEEFEQQLLREYESVGGVDMETLKKDHPEVFKTFVKMNNRHSSRMRQLTEESRSLEDRYRALSEVEQKAAAYDQLSKNPQWLAQLAGGASRQPANGNGDPQASYAPNRAYSQQDEGFQDEITPDNPAALAHLVRREIQQALSGARDEIRQEVIGALHPLYRREETREIDRLRERYPDGFTEHYQAAAELRKQNPQLPWEHAVKIAAFDSERESGRREALRAMTAKRRIADTASLNTFPVEDAGANSIYEDEAPAPRSTANMRGHQPSHVHVDPIDAALDTVWERFAKAGYRMPQ